jgi:long-subunit acyl-CoA synthetase (AMP-forming)
MDFMRVCFSAKVFEGYGQTENFCASCLVRKKQKPGLIQTILNPLI